MTFSARVIEWQLRHGRHDLPWQRTNDPYRIWLSEVMLQQTQVATVVPYFERFVRRFPDLQMLAAAPLDAVLEAWAGLGYYSRARNLHRCAQQLVARHGGAFPRSAATLAQLPGIGRTTAAAIAAFAYGERVAILDGNVKRVLARHFGVEGYPGAAATERELWRHAESQLPQARIDAYTQGLMDLGATLCLRRKPRCTGCPVQTTCVARRDDRIDEMPAPRRPRSRPLRAVTFALISDGRGAILLERRAPSGIWGGLLSAPEFDPDLSDAELERAMFQRFGLRGEVVHRGDALRHEFTHYSFLMQPRVVRVIDAPAVSEALGLEWLPASRFEQAALPTPVRRLLYSLLVQGREIAAT
jgi:A/G-specific adenine glycosylase